MIDASEVIGSPEWFKATPTFGVRGSVDCILRLLEQRRISRSKARELIQFATVGKLAGATGTIGSPSAPWEELNWSPDAVAE